MTNAPIAAKLASVDAEARSTFLKASEEMSDVLLRDVERDVYRRHLADVLEALWNVANHVYLDGDRCWCNAWEEDDDPPNEHHGYCIRARSIFAAEPHQERKP